MKKEAFADHYRTEMSDVHVSPQLRRQTLDALDGKEKPVMKKKTSLALVLVIAAMLISAAALAAVTRAGILDFAGRYANSYVPDDAQNYVQSDVMTMENNLVTVHLRELYYDGSIARMTVDVTPKDPKTMLLGADMSPEDNWQNMTLLNGEWDPEDQRTAVDVYHEEGFQSVYSVTSRLWSAAEVSDTSRDYNLGEDNVFTMYDETKFADVKAEREAILRVYLTPYGHPFNEQTYLWPDDRIIMEMPVLLQQPTYAYETYICTEAQEFSSVGVRVDEIRLEVRPQDIHTEILYTVIDRDAYNATEGGLWFEFIDPESTADTPWAQRLQSGMSSSASAGPADGKDMQTAVQFRQIESIGRNELHDTYTLRAYISWDKQRFETHTFTVVPANE